MTGDPAYAGEVMLNVSKKISNIGNNFVTFTLYTKAHIDYEQLLYHTYQFDNLQLPLLKNTMFY